MLVSPSFDIHSVTVGDIFNNTLFIPFKTVTKEKNVETQAMIDCGVGGVFIIKTLQRILNKGNWSPNCQKCGWNNKQKRDYQKLCGSRIQN